MQAKVAHQPSTNSNRKSGKGGLIAFPKDVDASELYAAFHAYDTTLTCGISHDELQGLAAAQNIDQSIVDFCGREYGSTVTFHELMYQICGPGWPVLEKVYFNNVSTHSPPL